MTAFVDRLQMLQIAIPLWAIEVSDFLTSVAGLFLLFAAYGLYRRLDGAWWLALSMTLLSIPFSLIKGLAVVAPSVSIILLIGLVAARRQFSRRASLLPISLFGVVYRHRLRYRRHGMGSFLCIPQCRIYA